MPWGLSVEYAPRVIEEPDSGPGSFCLEPGLLLLLAAAVGCGGCGARRSPRFLIFWFVLTLAPAVIVAPMVLQHDRYLYFPLMLFVRWSRGRFCVWGSFPERRRLVVALCVVALWSGLTWHEMSYWDCDMTLWSRVLEILHRIPGHRCSWPLFTTRPEMLPRLWEFWTTDCASVRTLRICGWREPAFSPANRRWRGAGGVSEGDAGDRACCGAGGGGRP